MPGCFIPACARLAAFGGTAALTPSVSLRSLPPTFSSTACRSRLPSTCARLRNGPPTTARVAEDPLRASPAPLGDTGLPPSFGPVRPSSCASPVRASHVTGLGFPNAPCPHHCGRLRRRFRQRASHVCRQRRPHSPPLSRRGGSLPAASHASIPTRSYRRFSVPDRMARALVFTPHAARCACPPCAPMAYTCLRTRHLSMPFYCWTERMSHRYTGDTRLTLPKIRTDTRTAYAHPHCFDARDGDCIQPVHARI